MIHEGRRSVRTSVSSSTNVMVLKNLCLDETARLNGLDDAGSSTHVGSSSAPNIESSLLVDPDEEQLTDYPKERASSTQRNCTKKRLQRHYAESTTPHEDIQSVIHNCDASLQFRPSTADFSCSNEAYDIRILNPYFPSVPQPSLAIVDLPDEQHLSLDMSESPTSRNSVTTGSRSTRCINPQRRVGPHSFRVQEQSQDGNSFAPDTTPRSQNPSQISSPKRRNLLKPPSPKIHRRPRRFVHRQSFTSTPLSGCTEIGTDSGKATSATPDAAIPAAQIQARNGSGIAASSKDEINIVKLDEIGLSQCPRCSSRSLYIPAPQAAAAIGALVYQAKLENKTYYGELIACEKRTDTPTTEVVATESLEFITDPLERTHRERKRWQQLLKTMFDHLATRGHLENAAPHVALKMWRSAQLDRESFLQVFPQLPGVVGERLFAAFDVNKNGVIDFEEFTNGLAILSSSNLNNKLKFIFNMYDLNGDGELSRDEMSMMLYHIPSSFSFLSNGRSRKLDREAGNGSVRRRSSSSSMSTSALVKMLRTSRGRHELTIAGQRFASQESQDMDEPDSPEEIDTEGAVLRKSRHHTVSAHRPPTYRSNQANHSSPRRAVKASAQSKSAVRTLPSADAPTMTVSLQPEECPQTSTDPPPPPAIVNAPTSAGTGLPPLDLGKVKAGQKRAGSNLIPKPTGGSKNLQIVTPPSPHTTGSSTCRNASPQVSASPQSAFTSQSVALPPGPPRAATMSESEQNRPQADSARDGQGSKGSPRRTTVVINSTDHEDATSRGMQTSQKSPRPPSTPMGTARKKGADPQIKAALTRLKLGVMAVSAPAVAGPSPRSRTHRDVLANPSPRQHASPRRFSLGSSSPSKENPHTGTESIDLANMSRILQSEKATEKTVKEFEALVDKLVDRAFQIYDKDDSPRRVDHMSFDKFCEAVMKFQELRLALEVFCQETIQPQSFMPVPPDVLSTSQATSKTNVLRSIGGTKKLAAKIAQVNEPYTTTNANATAQPLQIPLQNAVRSCVSDIEDPRAITGRTSSRKVDGPLNDEDEGSQNGFAVDCLSCGAQYFCRLRVDGTDAESRADLQESRKPVSTGRDLWESMTHRFTGLKGAPSSATHIPPCIRAHGDYVDFCGWLEKDGRRTGLSVRRFYLLRDRFLYYYRTVNDLTPLHATLITGCHCDKTINDPHPAAAMTQNQETMEGRRGSWPRLDLEVPKRFTLRYGFEIRPHYHGGRRSILYARTSNERDLWVKYINKASGVTGAGFHDVYMLQEPLGRGKFATVYRAMNRATMERVAVKILKKPDLSSADRQPGAIKKSWFSRRRHWGRKDPDSEEEENEASIREFQRTEVAVLRLLYHPNLIRLLDVFNTNQYLYLVMEWGPSGDLRRTIDIVKQLNAGLAKRREAFAAEEPGKWTSPGLTELWIPEWIVREIIIGVLQGLSYLHSSKRNVIHRDLKPDNVLIKILISQLKFTMKQCISGLPTISSNTFELVQPQRTKPRSRTTPVSNLGQIQSQLLLDGELDDESIEAPATQLSVALQPRDSSPASVARGDDTPSNESLDTVDFYPNVDSNGMDLEGGTDSSIRLTPMSIDAVRDQLRVAGLKHTETIPSCSPIAPQDSKHTQDPLAHFDSKKRETYRQRHQRHYKRGDGVAASATDLFRTPIDVSPLLSEDRGLKREDRVSQSVTLCKDVLDSQSPKDDTLMLRLGTMNMRRDSEACGRVAAETLNFWLFLHCLEWYDTPKIKERRKRRSLTLPASVAAGVDGSIASPAHGLLLPNVAGDELEGEFNENALIPPFLRHKNSFEILQESLNALKSTQTIQSMNALFSSSFVKDAIVPKITDFGLSKIVAPPSNHDVTTNATGLATYAEEALGTAAYAAPEVLAGRRYTTSADLWSLGVVTYQLLSGGFFPVFKEVTPSNRISSLDAADNTTGSNVSNTHDAATVSSLLGLSKRLRTNRRNHIKLVLLFQPEHAWGRVGRLGKEFVQKLLDIDPSTRLTARDALAEPWMSREFAFAS